MSTTLILSLPPFRGCGTRPAAETATQSNSQCKTLQITLQHNVTHIATDTATDTSTDTATRCDWHIMQTSGDCRGCETWRCLCCTECVLKKQKNNDGGWEGMEMSTHIMRLQGLLPQMKYDFFGKSAARIGQGWWWTWTTFTWKVSIARKLV